MVNGYVSYDLPKDCAMIMRYNSCNSFFYCFKPPAKYLFKLGEQRSRRDLKQKGTEIRKFGNKDLRYRELEL